MNDYIKREYAILLLNSGIETADKYNYDTDVMKRLRAEVIKAELKIYIKSINNIPSADVVEVRHGRWTGKTYKCSLCGKWVDPLQGDADMNYCPNCGAKMDGEEQENEHID